MLWIAISAYEGLTAFGVGAGRELGRTGSWTFFTSDDVYAFLNDLTLFERGIIESFSDGLPGEAIAARARDALVGDNRLLETGFGIFEGRTISCSRPAETSWNSDLRALFAGAGLSGPSDDEVTVG